MDRQQPRIDDSWAYGAPGCPDRSRRAQTPSPSEIDYTEGERQGLMVLTLLTLIAVCFIFLYTCSNAETTKPTAEPPPATAQVQTGGLVA